MRVEFGEFLFDSATRGLRREGKGKAVHLSPKAFDLLAALLERRPKALSKSAILERLWPGTFVSESSLTSVVAEVRLALGDRARGPRFLRTVHRFGYAFCGEAREATTSRTVESTDPGYRLVLKDREVVLREGENILGRTHDAVAWIESSTVSRRHARILITEAGAALEGSIVDAMHR